MERRDKRRDGYIQTDLENVTNGQMNRKTDGKQIDGQMNKWKDGYRDDENEQLQV